MPEQITQSSLRCTECDHDLTGVAIGGHCPECGTPIETSLDAIRMKAPLGEAEAPLLHQIIGACIVSVIVAVTILLVLRLLGVRQHATVAAAIGASVSAATMVAGMHSGRRSSKEDAAD